MRLRSEIVDLIGEDRIKPAAERRGVGEICIVELHPRLVRVVRIDVDVVDSLRVEVGGATDQAVNLVSFAEKEFGEVRPVLAGDAGDECDFAGRRRIGSGVIAIGGGGSGSGCFIVGGHGSWI